ncbi:MAG: carboxypeptidase-like regulatory domain-containing protein [Flavobacteriaceae bacterium]|nr:carboxypeptidase-like regulatory domain-containing protein [Flavobacteriaceae bacterium]
MSKYVLFLLVLILNYVSGFGQTELIGQVIDALTEEPIPYVNIGLVDENIGTVSDEQGYFQLEIDPLQYSQSNLRFSMIGFESKTYVLQEYLQKELLIIPLTEESTELEEVVVSTKRTQFETKILGNKTTTKLIYAAFTTNKLGNEMGFVVRQRKRPMILKKFNIPLVENDYGLIRFRLNFYSVENGLPTSTLLKENIIIETDATSGIVSKDLAPYEIVIDEDFFVSIEWIEDLGPGKLYFSGGFFGSPLIAREVSQGTWSKVGSGSVGMNVEVRY